MRAEELTLLWWTDITKGEEKKKHKQKEQKECLITFFFLLLFNFFSTMSTSRDCVCMFVRKRGDISERNSSIIYTFGLNWSSHHKKKSLALPLGSRSSFVLNSRCWCCCLCLHEEHQQRPRRRAGMQLARWPRTLITVASEPDIEMTQKIHRYDALHISITISHLKTL